MAQFIEFREEKTFRYFTNNPDTIDVSRGTLIRELLLRLQMTPTSTAANNAAANIQWGGPWGVIRRLEVILNGSDTILNLTGPDLTRLHYFLFGEAAEVPDTLGDGATANPPLDVFLIVPFWMPRAAKPLDTALDTRRLSSLEVRVTWGTFTDVIFAATAWTAEPVLTASFLRSSGGIPANTRFAEWRRFIITADITSSNAAQRINLPVGQVYRGLLLNIHNSSTIGDANQGGAINRLKVKSGPTVFADLTGEALREWSLQRYGIHRDSLPDVYSDGDNKLLTDWYYLDFVTDGRLAEAIDTARFSEFFVELDVTGFANGQVRILPQAFVPPRSA